MKAIIRNRYNYLTPSVPRHQKERRTHLKQRHHNQNTTSRERKMTVSFPKITNLEVGNRKHEPVNKLMQHELGNSNNKRITNLEVEETWTSKQNNASGTRKTNLSHEPATRKQEQNQSIQLGFWSKVSVPRGQLEKSNQEYEIRNQEAN